MPVAIDTTPRTWIALLAGSSALLLGLAASPTHAAPAGSVPDTLLGHWMAIERCQGGDTVTLFSLARRGRDTGPTIAEVRWNFLRLAEASPRDGDTVLDATLEGDRLHLSLPAGFSGERWSFTLSPDGGRLTGPTTTGCAEAVFERLPLGDPQLPPKVARPANVAAATAPAPTLAPVPRTAAACKPYRDVGGFRMTPELGKTPDTDQSVPAWESLLGVPRPGWTEGLFRAHAERSKGCSGVLHEDYSADQYLRQFADGAVTYYRERVMFEERFPTLQETVGRFAAAPLNMATAIRTNWFSPPVGVDTTYGLKPYSFEEGRWFDQRLQERRAALQQAVKGEVGKTALGIVETATLADPQVGELARTCAVAEFKAFACTAALDRHRMRMSDLRCQEAVAEVKLPADLAQSTVSIGGRPHPLDTLVCDAGRRGLRIGYAASGAMLWKSEKLIVSESGTPVGELTFTRQKGFNGSQALEITDVLGSRYTGKGHSVGERFLSCVAWDRC